MVIRFIGTMDLQPQNGAHTMEKPPVLEYRPPPPRASRRRWIIAGLSGIVGGYLISMSGFGILVSEFHWLSWLGPFPLLVRPLIEGINSCVVCSVFPCA